ncbi:hypothetical protein MLD38_012899 [Melastoma candidum]|nr:hypothetical protein MLD38_012899 [Melastoma candidum]
MEAESNMDIASPRGRGRLVLHGVVGGHAPGEPAAAARDESTSNSPPEKFIDEAKPHRIDRLTLPDIIVPRAATCDSSTAEKHATPKSLSKASSNGQKALPTIAVAIRHGELKNNPRQREMEAERSRDIPSPRGRGRLAAVRGNGIRTVDDLSNDEFNQNVEKYIAKTRRFLQEESMRDINLGSLYQDRSAGPRSCRGSEVVRRAYRIS